MSVPLARRQLLIRPGRTLAGLAGIAVALLLVLALKAIFAGMEERLTAYIDGSGADVIVAQEGVDTMHMTQSALPKNIAGTIGSLPGVEEARPVLYVPTLVERGDERGIVYLIGDDAGGAPLALSTGERPGAGEIVLESELARTLGAGPGATVMVLGRAFLVSGTVDGLASITNSVAIAGREDVASLLGSEGVVSYVLVRTRNGASPEAIAGTIERAVPGVTASTREAFARSERRVVGDMSTDIVRGMIAVGFVVGVAVGALVAYSSTLAQVRDYAVFCAVGLPARRALCIALAEVGAMVAAGFVVAVGLVLLLGILLPTLSGTLTLAVRLGDVAQVLAIAGAVALLAAALPVVRVLRVDPASVFRG